MRRISLVAISLCASFLAAHKVTSWQIKTGFWEVTTTSGAARTLCSHLRSWENCPPSSVQLSV